MATPTRVERTESRTSGGSGSTSDEPGWKEWLGRAGLAGKAVFYAVVGLLAAQLAIGRPEANNESITEFVVDQPGGRVLIIVLMVSLTVLAAWRASVAVFGDPEADDETLSRVVSAGKTVIYGGLAIAAASSALDAWSGGSSGGGGSSGSEQAASTAMDLPAGRWLVAAAGVGLCIWAARLVKEHVIDGAFEDRLDVDDHPWISALGRVGYAARAGGYLLIGVFLVQAGLTYDADKAQGLSGSLRSLARGDWGWTIWIVAAGFGAYAAYLACESRYRSDA